MNKNSAKMSESDLSRYDMVIFTDGSSRGNPGRGGWGLVVICQKIGWVDEFGAESQHTTNNEMELTAISEALQYIRIKNPQAKAVIYTDSSYAVNGATGWVAGWKRRGWKTATGSDVLNLELWKSIESSQKGLDVTYVHIRGHQGISGNERTDAIATAYADGVDPHLYSGSFSNYGVQNILDLTANAPKAARAHNSTPSKSSKSGQWYISFLDGLVERHPDWESCKKRVHGVKAKFKKVASKSEEESVLRAWGCL